MKHTKGPWSLDKKLMHKSEEMHILRDKNELVAEVKGDLGAAYLIAAAPEMLEELKQALRLLQSIEKETGYVTSVTQLHWEKLIAKAEGRDK